MELTHQVSIGTYPAGDNAHIPLIGGGMVEVRDADGAIGSEILLGWAAAATLSGAQTILVPRWRGQHEALREAGADIAETTDDEARHFADLVELAELQRTGQDGHTDEDESQLTVLLIEDLEDVVDGPDSSSVRLARLFSVLEGTTIQVIARSSTEEGSGWLREALGGSPDRVLGLDHPLGGPGLNGFGGEGRLGEDYGVLDGDPVKLLPVVRAAAL